jgi:hypothetical protein
MSGYQATEVLGSWRALYQAALFEADTSKATLDLQSPGRSSRRGNQGRDQQSFTTSDREDRRRNAVRLTTFAVSIE